MTEWVYRSVSDLVDGLTAGVSVRSTGDGSGGASVLKTSAIDAGRFDPREAKPILPIDLPRAKCPVRAHSMIVSRMNTPTLVGNVGYVDQDYDDLYLPDRLWLARSKRGSGTDMRWLTYYFASQPGARRLRSLATGTSGSMKNIPKDRVLNLDIATPSASEQHAIADALADADALIATLERLIAKKQAIKLGMMQNLLTGRTHVSSFSGQWRSTTLGDVVKVVGGGTPSRSISAYWGGRIPWATIKDISNFNPHGTQEYITPAALQASSARLVSAGTLVLAARMLVGKAVRFDVDVAINQDLKALAGAPDVVDPAYLRHWFDAYGSTLASSAGGSTVAGTSTGQIKAMPIELPALDEQQAIATVLDDADSEVAALRTRLKKAQVMKTGMMQELLTGRTRLPIGVSL
ncbi:restriction endonuclease subunit S [Kocuria marina]|uniref:restriction endonuclease subunit S n=1 Tax=Kocuria marina TaxID=223184 RepID=UPI0012EB330E|nr:restriction endonuclease subunit S [Kocuria marina]